MPRSKPASPLLRWSHPLAQGLVAAWVFHEGSGPSANDKAGNIIGTLQNGAVWKGGTDGWAISFSGATDQILIGDVLNNFRSAISIAALIFPIGYGGGGRGRVIDKLVASNNGFEFQVDDGTNGVVGSMVFAAGNGSAQVINVSANTITLSGWNAVVYAGGIVNGSDSMAFYINGASVAPHIVPGGSFPLADPTTNSAAIGNRASDGLRGFNGSIAYVYVYNRILSADEAKFLYVSPYDMFRGRTPLKSSAAAFFSRYYYDKGAQINV